MNNQKKKSLGSGYFRLKYSSEKPLIHTHTHMRFVSELVTANVSDHKWSSYALNWVLRAINTVYALICDMHQLIIEQIRSWTRHHQLIISNFFQQKRRSIPPSPITFKCVCLCLCVCVLLTRRSLSSSQPCSPIYLREWDSKNKSISLFLHHIRSGDSSSSCEMLSLTTKRTNQKEKNLLSSDFFPCIRI